MRGKETGGEFPMACISVPIPRVVCIINTGLTQGVCACMCEQGHSMLPHPHSASWNPLTTPRRQDSGLFGTYLTHFTGGGGR